MPEHAAAIFVNEGAGSARSARVRRTVALVRDALGADVHVIATRHSPTLEAWLHQHLEAHRYRTAIIAGGDGSLSAAYNIVAGRDLRLGYIPAGFGNATAHLLRLPRRPDRLAAVLARGDARPVDLVSIDGRLAFFAGAGWDALVAGRYAAAGARHLPGWAAALAASVPDLWRRPSVRVLADGEVIHHGPMELLVVSTTPFYGRGLLVNPGARPDAGRMVVRTFAGPAHLLALEAVRWIARRHPRAPGVAARVVELTSLDGRPVPVQADGDPLGEREEWRYEIRPAAARLIGRWR